MELEAEARLVEMHYINDLKPVFNSKDKYPGNIITKLRPSNKKFTHNTYVFNGKPTECVLRTEDGHILVNVINIAGKEVGVYYDELMNLTFSASDFMKAVEISKKQLLKIMEEIHNYDFITSRYVNINNGAEKEREIILCRY